MSVQPIVAIAAAAAFVGGIHEIRTSDIAQTQAAAVTDAEWCDDSNWGGDREYFCEVRELAASAGSLAITDNANGSIQVTGSGRSDIRIRARVLAQADTRADAEALARDVRVAVDGARVRTEGPSRSGRNRSWSVSYRIEAPARTDLELGSSNGSIAVTGVNGRISVQTSNGSLRMTDIGGDVEGRTSNGSVHVMLSGTSWTGTGLDIRTSNGSARVDIPENYNARLVTSTRNGSMRLDFPVTVSGRINRDLDTTLGSGGATIRVETSNGSVRIGRR